jgi:N-methylhydantoinase B
VLAEFDASGVRRNVTILQPLSGGMGAYRGHDGVDCRDSTMSNMSNHCIEYVEADCGVIIREYDICPDSGGAGRWRGGVGQKMTVEVLRDGGSVVPRGMERMRFPAWGVAGGRPSAPFRMVVSDGRTAPAILAKVDQFAVNKNTVVTVLMPGASGYGDPYERDSQDVRRDVIEGFVSREAAARDYGVVIGDDGSVDAAATTKKRARHAKSSLDFDFGPEREAWERVFDDATMCELNRRLFALPRSARYDTRRRVFESAVPNLPQSGVAPTLTNVLANATAARARLRKAMDTLLGP